MDALLWLKANFLLLFAVVFAIGLMILVHELGHFLMGKKVGILVCEFALGFGPKLWRRKIGETIYTLRLFPLGGFVHLKGLEEAVEDQDDPRGDPPNPLP